MKKDTYSLLLEVLKNPTKLAIIFLLMQNTKMTVTQMSLYVGVSKTNLYHFVGQMVRDGFLARPEERVKRNYVEKFYRLDWRLLASVDLSEQKKRLRNLNAKEQKTVIQSFLATLGLIVRLFSEEIARADDRMLRRIADSFAQERIVMSYLVLPDRVYQRAMRDVTKMLKTITRTWKEDTVSLRGNRMIVVGVPRLGEPRTDHDEEE
jgi:DNA-binding transcriptional ArsR family regulator